MGGLRLGNSGESHDEKGVTRLERDRRQRSRPPISEGVVCLNKTYNIPLTIQFRGRNFSCWGVL